jgi:hypothetical protein
MPREIEDEMVNQLSALRRELDEAIQRIVDARLAGKRDDEAIRELAALQNREVELSKPEFAEAA